MIAWAEDAVAWSSSCMPNPALYDRFGAFRSTCCRWCAGDGALELYDGVIRVRDAAGILIDRATSATST
jgi:NAD-reducing hydrogenase large subunit